MAIHAYVYYQGEETPLPHFMHKAALPTGFLCSFPLSPWTAGALKIKCLASRWEFSSSCITNFCNQQGGHLYPWKLSTLLYMKKKSGSIIYFVSLAHFFARYRRCITWVSYSPLHLLLIVYVLIRPIKTVSNQVPGSFKHSPPKSRVTTNLHTCRHCNWCDNMNPPDRLNSPKASLTTYPKSG